MVSEEMSPERRREAAPGLTDADEPFDVDALVRSGRQVLQTITPSGLGEITQSDVTIDDAEYFARYGCRREPPPKQLKDIPLGQAVRIRHTRLDQAAVTTCFACSTGSCAAHGVGP